MTAEPTLDTLSEPSSDPGPSSYHSPRLRKASHLIPPPPANIQLVLCNLSHIHLLKQSVSTTCQPSLGSTGATPIHVLISQFPSGDSYHSHPASSTASLLRRLIAATLLASFSSSDPFFLSKQYPSSIKRALLQCQT